VGYVPSGHYFSGSVVDAGMEGVSNAGVHFLSADQETIQGGRSEQNKYGILINTSASGVNSGTSNKFNMVLTMDLEGNQVNFQGSDVTDNSSLNTFWNVLSATACSSCQAVQLSTTGEDYYSMGFAITGVAGQSNGNQVPGAGFSTAAAGSATLPTNPVGFLVQQFQGVNVLVPYYH
jgi:hypothetical protein